MSSFNGLLDAIFLPPRNWVLNKALRFKSDDLDNTEVKMLKECGVDCIDNGKNSATITVPKGYITDLASVPRVCWAFIAPFDVARAAVIHDIMYEKINGAFKEGVILTKKQRELYRSIADKVFRQGMENSEPSVPNWKIKSAYYSVRMFGRWAINGSAPRGAKPQAKK
tara:strand:- start:9007 stop:9510 length:504 start_codon:yes stop_codon:yes gene_type:complete